MTVTIPDDDRCRPRIFSPIDNSTLIFFLTNQETAVAIVRASSDDDDDDVLTLVNLSSLQSNPYLVVIKAYFTYRRDVPVWTSPGRNKIREVDYM